MGYRQENLVRTKPSSPQSPASPLSDPLNDALKRATQKENSCDEPRKEVLDMIVPILSATWNVQITIVTILSSLPPLLQIPLFALTLSIWVIPYTWISEASARR